MRPEGVVNPYKEPIREGVTWNREVIQAWEKGADAMLEALKKQLSSEYSPAIGTEKAGWMVFIEETVEVGGEVTDVGDGKPPTVITK